MDALSECFIKEADALLAEHSAISHEWLHRSPYAELMLRGSESAGFDVRVLADTTEVIVYVEGAETRFCALKNDHVPSVVVGLTRFRGRFLVTV